MSQIKIEKGIPIPGHVEVPRVTAAISGSKDKWGQEKATRYKWNNLGKPGEFMWCDKEELHVDHGYQRDRISNKRLNLMAADWDWVSCGCLCVAEREGKWYVIDGQHRKLAADKRSDIKHLPCLVFDLDSRSQEAQAFVDLNSNKTAVQGVDRFKAMIVAGDQTAIGLNELLVASGRPAAAFASPATVACIMLLWKRYGSDSEMFADVWPLICAMSTGQPIPNAIVRAMWWAEAKAKANKVTLCHEPYRTVLTTAGTALINAEIIRERAIAGIGGERVEGAALLRWLNRQKLGNRYKINIDVDNDEEE